MRRGGHRLENSANKFERHFGMKKIAHRIDEYSAWLLPRSRKIDQIPMQRDLEFILVPR